MAFFAENSAGSSSWRVLGTSGVPSTGGEQAGFTLIELLIVMAIVALMTLLAVMNFTAVERQARLDFAADSLVAVFREQQVLARSGRVNTVDGKSVNQCFAVKLVAGSGSGDAVGGVWVGQSDYVLQGQNKVDQCEDVSAWQKREILDAGVRLAKVVKDGNDVQSGSDEVLYFKPPFGQVLESSAAGQTRLGQGKFEFTLASGVTDTRVIEYDVATGEVKRKVGN